MVKIISCVFWKDIFKRGSAGGLWLSGLQCIWSLSRNGDGSHWWVYIWFTCWHTLPKEIKHFEIRHKVYTISRQHIPKLLSHHSLLLLSLLLLPYLITFCLSFDALVSLWLWSSFESSHYLDKFIKTELLIIVATLLDYSCRCTFKL